MSIPVTQRLTESQQFQADRCNRFCADPKQYFLREYREFIESPLRFFIIRQMHSDQAERDDFAMLMRRLARVIPSPGDILMGRICPPERVTLITQVGLTGASAAGVVGVVAGIITGLPPVTALSAALVVGSVAGIHAAADAASLRERVEDAARLTDQLSVLEGRSRELGTEVGRLTTENTTLQGTSERLGGQVTRFSEHIDHLTGENITLQDTSEKLARQLVSLEGQSLEFRGVIDRLHAENGSLGEKVARLQEGILQFSVQNENYRRIGEQFSLYLEAFRTGNMEGREVLSAKILEFTGQLTASRELWDRVSCDTAIFREGYELQISQLTSLISQITDPRHTLTRLEEHRAIGEQIRHATSALEAHQRELSRVVEDLSRREGEIRARDQLLRELELAHRQILVEYGEHAAAHRTRNAELSEIIQRITGLVSQSFAGERRKSVSVAVR
jgi:predicted nuclease with TOPRIM domain